MKSEDIALILEPMNKWVCVVSFATMNSPGKRVLWKVLELPQVYILFFGTLLLCQARCPFIKPLADMNKMYQIHLCTYKDLCSLTDGQCMWWSHQCPQKTQMVISHSFFLSLSYSHTHTPYKKRGQESSHASNTFWSLQTSSIVEQN